MHEKLSKNSRIFAVNFVIENFELFIVDRDMCGAQIHAEGRSILDSKTYKI